MKKLTFPAFFSLCTLCALVFFHEKASAQFVVERPSLDSIEALITDTVYMSPEGLDSNPGTRDAPVGSFGKALDLLPWGGPGGEAHGYGLIRLLPGTYRVDYGMQQVPNQWRRDGKFKNVSVEGLGDVTVCGSPEQPAVGHLLHLRGQRFFVKNLKLKYATIHGLLLSRPSLTDGLISDVYIENVRVDSVRGFGMLLSGTERVWIAQCTSAYAARLDEELVTEPCQWPSGIKFVQSRHSTITHSAVYGTRGEGLNFHNTRYGLAAHNELRDNPTNLYLDNSANIIAHNNRIFSTPGEERNWRTCPDAPIDSIPPMGILIANEGACPESLSPIKANCHTDCVIPFGPVVYRYRDVDSIYIYQNLMHRLQTAVGFWEGATNIIGFNCIRNVFIFHNSIFGAALPAGHRGRGLFDFFFPAAHNLILNSGFSELRNVQIWGNLLSFSEKSKGTQSVYRTVTDPLFPVPLEIHSDYNVYPAQHARLGPNDEVRGNLPYAPDIDSFARWRPCPDRAIWHKAVPNQFELTADFGGTPRHDPTNAGAFEYAESCDSTSGTRGYGHQLSTTWRLTPNPASDRIRLHCRSHAGPLQGNLTLLSAYGQVLERGRFQYPEFEMDISRLPAGVYLLAIECDDAPMHSGLIRWIKI